MLSTIRHWMRRRARVSERRTPADPMHYWINPDRETARAGWMSAELEKSGLRNLRVAACTPDALPALHLHRRHTATPLQLACLCSHFAAIERGLDAGEDMFMVIEDDIAQPFTIDFERLVDSAPRGWGILQLYVVNADRLDAMYTRSYLRGRLWERWRAKNHSTGAYLCSRDAALELVARFRRGAAIDVRGHRGPLVADDLLYRAAATYSMTYPLYIENAEFGSTLNSLRRLHLASHEVIRRIWSDAPSPDFATPRSAAPARA